MKDYSLTYDGSKTFVLNYEISDNQIIVNLASGEKYTIPYTLENEKKLLERMKYQVQNSSDYVRKQEKNFSMSWKWAIFELCMLLFNSISALTGASANILVSSLCAGWFGIALTFRTLSMIISKKNIADVKKNRYFLENEERLNEKVRDNSNILSNTKQKTKEMVSSTPIEKEVFNINTIDQVTYSELKQIMANIERDESFGFDYSEVQEEKPMVLTKRKK